MFCVGPVPVGPVRVGPVRVGPVSGEPAGSWPGAASRAGLEMVIVFIVKTDVFEKVCIIHCKN